MSCGVGRRHGSDLALLWLWCRPVATALIRPLAWEPPYATIAALKSKKKKKLNSKQITLRAKPIKHLEENKGENPQDLGLGRVLKATKARCIKKKTGKLAPSKLKLLCFKSPIKKKRKEKSHRLGASICKSCI